MTNGEFLALAIIGLTVYFLPLIVAAARGHPNDNAIFALNLFLGWTFIGWVAAPVWALTSIGPLQGQISVVAQVRESAPSTATEPPIAPKREPSPMIAL